MAKQTLKVDGPASGFVATSMGWCLALALTCLSAHADDTRYRPPLPYRPQLPARPGDLILRGGAENAPLVRNGGDYIPHVGIVMPPDTFRHSAVELRREDVDGVSCGIIRGAEWEDALTFSNPASSQ